MPREERSQDYQHMSRGTKKQLVPKLRFPEFQDKGEWEEKMLGACLSRHPEYGINAPAVPYTDNLPTYLRITDISEDGNFLKNQKVSVAKKVSYENYLSEGDIVLARTGASVGKSYKYKKIDGELVFAGFLIRIRPDGEKLNSELLFQFLFTEQYRQWVSFSSARSGQPGINSNQYAALPVPLPPMMEEQQKIADCLSSLDELITAHTQKLDALKEHKKGLMQQLFPQEGETVPKLRFPEFQDKGEWDNKLLGELYSFQVTNSYPRDKLNYNEGSIKNIHYGDIHTKFFTLFNIEKEIVPFINPQVPLEKIKSESYCIEGDMIFADASEDLDDIGKCIEIIHLNNEKLLSGLHTILARQKRKEIIIGFSGYLFKSNLIRNQIKKEAQGAKVLGITAGRLSNMKVNFPSDKREQQKIADCLSSLDELITAHTQKLDALKNHKKGLMQQLFPTIEKSS